MRLYIGIGRPEKREDVIHYVLSMPSENELPIYQAAFVQAADKILDIAEEFYRDEKEE